MKPVVCLMGPTASGKTDLALWLCDRLPMDIVSVDSALVYRGMDIGTAKPEADVLRQYPHALVDILDPAQAYSAARFVDDAKKEIQRIQASDRIPLLVGGTMLYFHALQGGLDDLPQADEALRMRLRQEAEQAGWPALHARLVALDPAVSTRIKPNDSQRIQRALELIEITGQTPSELYASGSAAEHVESRYLNFALMPEDRSALHERIAMRYKLMIEKGLLAEVKALMSRGDLSLELPSMRCVGYRQSWQHLQGDYSLDESIERGIIATRQLAKRQMTWLRRTGLLLSMDPLLTNAGDRMLAALQEQKLI